MHVFFKQMAIGLEVLLISQCFFQFKLAVSMLLSFQIFTLTSLVFVARFPVRHCSTFVVHYSAGFGLFATATFDSELPHPRFLCPSDCSRKLEDTALGESRSLLGASG